MSIDLYIVNKMIKLLTKLDQLVLKRVLWGYSLDATTRLSVNLSAKSLVNKKFQKVLLAILEKNRVDLNKVVFEITETSMITDFASIERYMAILKKRGAVFALDDFGSGFSGWQSFRNLDFEWIKIDGEFIVNIDSNPQDQVIVNSLINVVHKLNKHIVVEWVETPAVYEYLAKRNIEMMQGFYLARPQCIDKLLSASTWQEKNKQVNNNNRLKHVISTKAEITSNT